MTVTDTTTRTETQRASTTTLTETETATRTTQRTTTQQAPQTTQPQQQQWPSPPYAAGNGFEWVRRGPYSSTWTCGQAQGQWPAGTSECFIGPDANAWFYGIRQASR